ncbi:hypothetical protein BJ912DRAFT_929634 [Pholiota molesta]|nr:hypothetical protein BJ912DRAFT_929634 [Pholiota molesta]
MQPRVKLRISKAAAALPCHARVPETAPRARRGEEPAHEQREGRPPAAACSARRGGAGNARCRRGAAPERGDVRRASSSARCVTAGVEASAVESSRRARPSSHTLAPGGAERERVHGGEVGGREEGAEGGDGAAV